MTKTIAKALVVLVCGAGLVLAQAKQPKPKSKGEVEAIMAIQNAATAQARLAAIDTLLTKYADTEFKPMVLAMAAQTAQQMGDMDKAIIYAEQTLDVDKKNYQALLLLAQAWATRTKEFDLDKEEKLGNAEKYAKSAIEILATAESPNPALTADQWGAFKKDLTSQGHEALGTVAVVRKKWDVAIAEYKIAVEGAATPDPATMVRLAGAYGSAGKYDDEIAILDKVLAIPDAHPTVKNVATQEKARALKNKAATAPKPAAPAPPPAAPAPQPAQQ